MKRTHSLRLLLVINSSRVHAETLAEVPEKPVRICGGGGWGGSGNLIEPPKLKQLTSETCINIEQIQSILNETLTLPYNGGNRVFDDLKFQNFPGEDEIPPY